jgi:hypothetical protein
MATIWKGIDGSMHEFSPHPYESDWTDAAGVFIFAAQISRGNWNPLFIGHTDSFEHSIPGHEKWPWAVILGATHVLACAVATQAMRCSVETEMIARLKPPLNSIPQAKSQVGGIRRRA